MASTRALEIGQELPSVSKQVTQEKIDLFEGCGILHGANIHTDPDVAARRLGTTYPVASGRMSLAYVSQVLRSALGPDAFHRTGVLNLKFLRPVGGGDTITVGGRVTDMVEEGAGARVVVEVWCHNQNGDVTAAGTASAVVQV